MLPEWSAARVDPGPNGDGGQTVVDHIRLFPVREDVRWTYYPGNKEGHIPTQSASEEYDEIK